MSSLRYFGIFYNFIIISLPAFSKPSFTYNGYPASVYVSCILPTPNLRASSISIVRSVEDSPRLL